MDRGTTSSAVRPALVLGLVSLLFVLSGATGLGYEVIWFRRFSQIWGGSSAAMAAVVASFLFGLGLGAHSFGPLADRVGSPLRIYAGCELTIGLLAIAIPFELEVLFAVSSQVYPDLAGHPLLFAGVRFLATFVVLGPPTVLMGATLPLLVRQFALVGSPLARATSWLYFANSFGAAVGAWVVGFHLLPAFGLQWSNGILAAGSLSIALVSWSLVKEAVALPRVPSSEPEPEESPTPAPMPRGVVAAAFLAGLGGVALQMVWARQMSLMVGGTTYAFTAVLAVFILGLAGGSLVFRLFLRDIAEPTTVVFVSTLGLVTTTLVGWMLAPLLGEVAGAVSELRVHPGFNALLCFSTSAVLEGPPTFFMGILFPTLVALSGRGRASAGRTVGRLYAWNTAGSILAATTASVLLFPALGTFGTIVAMAGAYALALAWIRGPGLARMEAGAWASVGSVVLAIAVGAIAGRPDLRDQKRRNIGSYLYTEKVFPTIDSYSEVLYFREAPTCNVMVLGIDGQAPGEKDDRLITLRVNGKVDGGNLTDMTTQLGSAYFPRFLRPESEEVLVIGFGTGTTAGASCLFPGTRVDCCEIEPAIVEASPMFHETNHAPELQPLYRTIPADGRNYVQGTDRLYDLVISEPSNPWIAGIANLYTREFYLSLRDRLRPGGLLTQWVQAYLLGRSEFSLIVHTIQEVFPHTALLKINEGDTLLLASMRPIVPSREEIDRAQALVDENEPVRADLLRRFATADVRTLLLTHLVLDRAGLERIVLAEGQSSVNTDSNLRLEFDAPKKLFGRPADEEISVPESILHATDASVTSDLISGWGWTEDQLLGLEVLRTKYFDAEYPAMAVAMSSIGLAYSDRPTFLADQLIYAPPADDADFRAGVRQLLASSRPEVRRVALTLGHLGQPARSAAAYEEMARAYPDSASVCASLAVVYDQLGRSEDARAMLERAVELDPLSEGTLVVERAMRVREMSKSERPGDRSGSR